jgi:hypothetical protein
LRKILLLVFLAQIVTNQSIAQELKLNLLTNESYYHNNTTHVKMSQDIQGELMVTDAIYGGKMRFKVKEKTDSLYHLEIYFETVHFSAIMGETSFSADTEKVDSLSVFDLIMKEMTRSPFEATISEYGIVRDVEMGNLFDNLLSLDLDIPKLDQAHAVYTLEQTFGEKAMKGSLEMFTAIYPQGPVTVGDVWNNTIRLETISGVTLNNQFELLDRNSNKTVIKINSETISDKDESFTEMNGEFYRISSNGKMEATHILDSKTGWIIESEIVQDITGLNEKKWRENSAIIIKIPFTYEGLIKMESD